MQVIQSRRPVPYSELGMVNIIETIVTLQRMTDLRGLAGPPSSRVDWFTV